MRSPTTVIKRLQKVEYHRNGIMGDGFMVGIANCLVDGEERKMLFVQFPKQDENGETPKDSWANMQTAVLDVDLLGKGDIGGLLGENQWRGDQFADEFAKKGQAVLDRKFAKFGVQSEKV
jgi:hypothetical protein